MTPARINRALKFPGEVELWCQDFAGIVEKDEAGRPVRFRKPCRNRACCTPSPGTVPWHVWDLRTGEFETVERPDFRLRANRSH